MNASIAHRADSGLGHSPKNDQITTFKQWPALIHGNGPSGDDAPIYAATFDDGKPEIVWGTVGTIADKIGDRRESNNWYLPVGLPVEQLPNGKRGGAGNVHSLSAVVIDIDTSEGVHGKPNDRGIDKYGNPIFNPDTEPLQRCTKVEAIELLDQLLIDPTYIVDSGGGIHAWYVLDKPVDPESINLDRWANTVWRLGTTHEIAVDHVVSGDKARVMRWPGTTNHKGDEPQPVTVVQSSGQTVTVDDIEAAFHDFQPEPEREQQPEPLRRINVGGDDSPIDWYNNNYNVADLVELAGWISLGRRSGKGDELYTCHQAGRNITGVLFSNSGRFWVWSATAPLPPNQHGYDAFEAYKYLRHQGDERAALMEIRTTMMPKPSKRTAAAKALTATAIKPVRSTGTDEPRPLLEAVPDRGEPETEVEYREREKERFVSTLLNIDQLRQLPPPVPMLGDYLDREMVAFMPGKFGSGKSFALLNMGLSVATGKPWLGQETHHTGVVWYFMGEGLYTISSRVTGWELANNCEVPNDRFLASSNRFDLSDHGESWRGLVWECEDRLAAGLEVPALIIFDTYSQHMAGDETPENTKAALEAMYKIRDTTGAAIITATHTGHNVSGRSRGDSTLEDNADVVLPIDGKLADPVTSSLVPVKMINTKQKARELQKPLWVKLRLVDDDEGNTHPYLDVATDSEVNDAESGNQNGPTQREQLVTMWRYLTKYKNETGEGVTRNMFEGNKAPNMASELSIIPTRKRWDICGVLEGLGCVEMRHDGRRGTPAFHPTGLNPSEVAD